MEIQRISVTYGATANIGNYESIRGEITLEAETTIKDLDKDFEILRQKAVQKTEEAIGTQFHKITQMQKAKFGDYAVNINRSVNP
jgi:hypothetical protein